MDLSDNKKEGQPVAPGLAHELADNSCKLASPVLFAIQTILIDVSGVMPPSPTVSPGEIESERYYARRAANALGDHLRDHSIGNLEAALATAGIKPPVGARLRVVHPMAVRLAQRDGLAVQIGNATHAFVPHAHGGLIRKYRAAERG